MKGANEVGLEAAIIHHLGSTSEAGDSGSSEIAAVSAITVPGQVHQINRIP